jgi:hypothetical protein
MTDQLPARVEAQVDAALRRRARKARARAALDQARAHGLRARRRARLTRTEEDTT